MLEHFERFEVHRLNFIPDKLPRGITKEMVNNGAFFTISSYNERFCEPIILTKGEIISHGRFKNSLKLILDDELAPQTTATVSSKNPTTTAPPVQPKEKSSLLNTPKRQDEWFEVINETVNQFYAENEVMPTATQVWNLLSVQPPTGYAITTGNDKGEICLIMMGCKPLNKSAFDKRMINYTK